MKLFSAQAAKAQIAGLTAALSVLVAGLAADEAGWPLLVAGVLAYLVAMGSVYSVPNRPPPVRMDDLPEEDS